MTLDLRNNTITVGELLDNRASRSVFQRRFGKFMNHPLVGGLPVPDPGSAGGDGCRLAAPEDHPGDHSGAASAVT